MSEPSDPGAGSERGEEEPQPKQIEKIKADNEKLKDIKNEKEFKNEKFEKYEKLEKNEKYEKNELKELKHDKPEKERKEFKFEKLEKEIKERKPEFEKLQIEGGIDPTKGVDPGILSRHADALEEAARQLRHFIEESERPDLSRGALKDEPDQGGET